MNWKVKSFSFKALSLVPYGDHIHYALQKNVTKSLPLSKDEIDKIISRTKTIVSTFQAYNETPLKDASFFEFGAGRNLSSPICMAYEGVGAIVTADIKILAKLDLIKAGLSEIAYKYGERPSDIETIEELGTRFGVYYHAPIDTRHTNFTHEKFDCVTSWNTLEHIPIEDIIPVLEESYRILKKRGIVVMNIDYSDHFSHADEEISSFNFLKYSDKKWKYHNSRLQYQNRLRHSEFVQLFKACKLQVLTEKKVVEKPIKDVKENLSEKYVGFSDDDLFTKSALIAARKN